MECRAPSKPKPKTSKPYRPPRPDPPCHIPDRKPNIEIVNKAFSIITSGDLKAIREFIMRNGIVFDVRRGDDNDDNQSLVHAVVMSDNMNEDTMCDVLKLLIDKRAPINWFDKNNVTALHIAAQKQKAKVAQLLADNGADKEAIDNAGMTPLHYAVRGSIDECKKDLKKLKLIDVKVESAVSAYMNTDKGRETVFKATKKMRNNGKFYHYIQHINASLNEFERLFPDKHREVLTKLIEIERREDWVSSGMPMTGGKRYKPIRSSNVRGGGDMRRKAYGDALKDVTTFLKETLTGTMAKMDPSEKIEDRVREKLPVDIDALNEKFKRHVDNLAPVVNSAINDITEAGDKVCEVIYHNENIFWCITFDFGRHRVHPDDNDGAHIARFVLNNMIGYDNDVAVFRNDLFDNITYDEFRNVKSDPQTTIHITDINQHRMLDPNADVPTGYHFNIHPYIRRPRTNPVLRHANNILVFPKNDRGDFNNPTPAGPPAIEYPHEPPGHIYTIPYHHLPITPNPAAVKFNYIPYNTLTYNTNTPIYIGPSYVTNDRMSIRYSYDSDITKYVDLYSDTTLNNAIVKFINDNGIVNININTPRINNPITTGHGANVVNRTKVYTPPDVDFREVGPYNKMFYPFFIKVYQILNKVHMMSNKLAFNLNSTVESLKNNNYACVYEYIIPNCMVIAFNIARYVAEADKDKLYIANTINKLQEEFNKKKALYSGHMYAENYKIINEYLEDTKKSIDSVFKKIKQIFNTVRNIYNDMRGLLSTVNNASVFKYMTSFHSSPDSEDFDLTGIFDLGIELINTDYFPPTITACSGLIDAKNTFFGKMMPVMCNLLTYYTKSTTEKQLIMFSLYYPSIRVLIKPKKGKRGIITGSYYDEIKAKYFNEIFQPGFPPEITCDGDKLNNEGILEIVDGIIKKPKKDSVMPLVGNIIDDHFMWIKHDLIKAYNIAENKKVTINDITINKKELWILIVDAFVRDHITTAIPRAANRYINSISDKIRSISTSSTISSTPSITRTSIPSTSITSGGGAPRTKIHLEVGANDIIKNIVDGYESSNIYYLRTSSMIMKDVQTKRQHHMYGNICAIVDTDVIDAVATRTNLNYADHAGATPLLYSVEMMHTEIIKYLIELGASPFVKSHTSPMEYHIETYLSTSVSFNGKIQEYLINICKPYMTRVIDALNSTEFRDASIVFAETVFHQCLLMYCHSLYNYMHRYEHEWSRDYQTTVEQMLVDNDLLSNKDRTHLPTLDTITHELVKEILLDNDDIHVLVNEIKSIETGNDTGINEDKKLTNRIMFLMEDLNSQEDLYKKNALNAYIEKLKNQLTKTSTEPKTTIYNHKKNIDVHNKNFLNNIIHNKEITKTNNRLYEYRECACDIVEIYDLIFENIFFSDYSGIHYKSYRSYASMLSRLSEDKYIKNLTSTQILMSVLQYRIYGKLNTHIKSSDNINNDEILNVLKIIQTYYKKVAFTAIDGFHELPKIVDKNENPLLFCIYHILVHVIGKVVCSNLYYAIVKIITSLFVKLYPTSNITDIFKKVTHVIRDTQDLEKYIINEFPKKAVMAVLVADGKINAGNEDQPITTVKDLMGNIIDIIISGDDTHFDADAVIIKEIENRLFTYYDALITGFTNNAFDMLLNWNETIRNNYMSVNTLVTLLTTNDKRRFT